MTTLPASGCCAVAGWKFAICFWHVKTSVLTQWYHGSFKGKHSENMFRQGSQSIRRTRHVWNKFLALVIDSGTCEYPCGFILHYTSGMFVVFQFDLSLRSFLLATKRQFVFGRFFPDSCHIDCQLIAWTFIATMAWDDDPTKSNYIDYNKMQFIHKAQAFS